MSELKLPIEEQTPDKEEQYSPQVHDVMPDEEDRKPIVPDEISILPLRDSVIYPMLIAPLSITREGGIKLIDDAVSGNNRVIGVVAQRDPQSDEPGFDGVHDYGCAVIIRTLVKLPDSVRLIVQGIQRFRIVERITEAPYMRARIEVIDEPVVTEEG